MIFESMSGQNDNYLRWFGNGETELKEDKQGLLRLWLLLQPVYELNTVVILLINVYSYCQMEIY